MRINFKTLFYMLLPFMIASGCNPLQTKSNVTQFDDSFRLYSKHLRWGHYREITHFMTTEHQTTSLSKVNQYQNKRVSEIEPLGWTILDDSTRIIGDIQIKYYVTDRGVIRTTKQTQEWLYKDEVWQLNSPLPDL